MEISLLKRLTCMQLATQSDHLHLSVPVPIAVTLMEVPGMTAKTTRMLLLTLGVTCTGHQDLSLSTVSQNAMGYFMDEGLGFVEVGDGFKKTLGRYFCKKGKRQYLVLSPTLCVHSYCMC